MTRASSLTRIDIRGTTFAVGSIDAAVDVLEDAIVARRKTGVAFANVHVVETARKNDRLREALSRTEIIFPDGAPIAWAARLATREPVRRICGADVFDRLCRRPRPYRHFFFGSTDAVLNDLIERVSHAYPDVVVCGTYSPPFGEDWVGTDDAVNIINGAAPDIVWVGLGAPKQEIWMESVGRAIEAPLILGVGAVFDFVSGNKRRAPTFMQQGGLEWLYRLAQEPRRLARRYLKTNTSFVLGIAGHLLRGSTR